MVSERSPVYIAFDTSNTPSSLNIFADSDVLAIDNGGTGVSSLTGLGQALSATTVSAGTLSATTVSALNFYTNTSSITVGTTQQLPVPNPFVYVQLDAAGTDSTDEQSFGTGVTDGNTTVITSDGAHITWDNTAKHFNVSSAGTYEIIGNFAFDSGSQSDPLEITSKKNGSDVHIFSPKQYGATGPNENSFHSVLTAAASDYITVTLHMDDGGTKTGHLEIGSNLTLKRIL